MEKEIKGKLKSLQRVQSKIKDFAKEIKVDDKYVKSLDELASMKYVFDMQSVGKEVAAFKKVTDGGAM